MPTPDYSMRHVIFNGESDESHGLTMSGNTPLIKPVPKRDSVTVPYSDGSIDKSELDGQLYFEDLSVSYVLLAMIPKIHNGIVYDTNQMNSLCNDKIQEVEDWLYSGPATLTDYGLKRSLSNADCVGLSIDKAMSTNEWVVKFTVNFKAPFNIPFDAISIPYYSGYNGRFIVFNGYSSCNVGLHMVGSTPLTNLEAKRSSMNYIHKNGSLDTSRGRNGMTWGKDSMFYNDRQIGYSFNHTISKFKANGTVKNVCEMNQECQEYVESICKWLYIHSPSRFATINGNVTYGGLDFMLIDSGWIDSSYDPAEGGTYNCKCLPSARVTDLSVSKNLFNDRWSLEFDVTFTTFPTFFDCELYIPASSSQSHSPVISMDTWKHYAELYTDAENSIDSIPMIEFKNDNDIDDAIYSGFTKNDITIVEAFSSYTVNNDTSISFDFVEDVPLYIHKSISGQTLSNPPVCAIVCLPKVISITINDVTKYYIPYFSAVDESLIACPSYVTLIDPEGNVVYEDDDYSMQLYSVAVPITENNEQKLLLAGTITLAPCDGYGISNNSGFTSHQLEADSTYVTLPITYWYTQGMFGDDILNDYGVYPDREAYAPDHYFVCTAFVADYSGDVPSFGYSALQYDFINSDSQNDKKFDHPAAYNGSGYPIWLNLPLDNGDGNNYILCDSNKPEGGDIQWL